LLNDALENPPATPRRVPWILALPFLVALAPVLFLWSANAATVEISDVLPLIGVLTATTTIVLIPTMVVTGSTDRTVLAVAVLWLPVLTFGRQLAQVRLIVPDAPMPAVVALDLIVVGLALVVIWRMPAARSAARFATVAALLFGATTVPGILAGISAPVSRSQPAMAGETADGPDIYFIVLDGYGRADVLEKLYGFDNDEFLDALRARGFSIADASYSNYSMTYLSLAGTLNMDYIPPALAPDFPAVDAMIEDAAVIHELQHRGYRYVHFETEFWVTANAPLADITFRRAGFASEFERAFFETSMLGSVLPSPPRHEVVLNTFDDLATVPDIPDATFTFSHLLVPHPPFMFRADGSVLTYEGNLGDGFEVDPYVEQLRFVNDRVLETVDRILEGSDQQPIIVIQGDHGPASFPYATPEQKHWERQGVLNAMLVPDSIRPSIYSWITTVNTFRVILQRGFGADLPLLDDRVFHNWYVSTELTVPGDHLQLSEITDLLPWPEQSVP
jgi:hypothetical protein